MKNTEHRKNERKMAMKEAKAFSSEAATVQDVGAPPDDYRLLPVVPDVSEILSEERVYLRKNIVNGVYEDAQHYLDVSIDFLSLSLVSPTFTSPLFSRSTFVCYAKISSVPFGRASSSISQANPARISLCVSMTTCDCTVLD